MNISQFDIQVNANNKQENIIIETQEIYLDLDHKQKKVETIELIGHKHFNMLHGAFYYKINNNEIINAGEFRENQKVGLWMDIQKNLQQCGEYQNGKRVGNWQFIIDRTIIALCSYNQDGEKHGKWIDVYTNNMKKYCQILSIGEYNNGKRVGKWIIKFKAYDQIDYEEIGGGEYDQMGNKVGYWVDVNESHFDKYSQIIQEGQYNSGIRVGSWMIKYREFSGQPFIQVGGGKFDQCGKKVGKWVEINESYFSFYAQLILEGQYLEGLRDGDWIKNFRAIIEEPFGEIGIGEFDKNGKKIGHWVDINDSQFTYSSQVVWYGEYYSGLRVGHWEISFCQDSYDKYDQIGGGNYDILGKKTGDWVDINESCFKYDSQVIWLGQYQRGFKVGEWIIKYRLNKNDQFRKIGGGKFDQNGNKIGLWIDINESKFSHKSQLIQQGQYQSGYREGEWSIKFRVSNKEKFIQIGGGTYDEFGNKIGKWIEINESHFCRQSKIIREGNYQGGHRTGEWIIKYSCSYNDPYLQIGGGKYDEKGNKVGYWVDINESYFYNDQEVIWEGSYQGGIRVGEWIIKYRTQTGKPFIQIGGGMFNQNGNKVGLWVDINEQYFNIESQLIWQGQYQGGLRVGEWITKYRMYDVDPFIQIGGGKFNQSGNKEGHWIDINESNFDLYTQVIWEGQYLECNRFGKWMIKYREKKDAPFIQIGGGNYNSKGKKVGKWLDLYYSKNIQEIEYMNEQIEQ